MPLSATQREERNRERVGEVAIIAELADEEMEMSVGPQLRRQKKQGLSFFP
jgi:hypothetical protein